MTSSINNEVADELLTLVEDSLEQAKVAYAELRKLRDEKVELEKVASAPVFDRAVVIKTAKMLVRNHWLLPEEQEKFASDLTERPDKALKLVQRLLEISAPAYDEGRGVPKSASTTTSDSSKEDNSLWAKVVTEGA